AATSRMRSVELEVPVVPDRRGGHAGGEEGREVDRRGDALVGRQLRLDQDVERRASRDLREMRVAVVVDGHAGPVRDADAEGLARLEEQTGVPAPRAVPIAVEERVRGVGDLAGEGVEGGVVAVEGDVR